MLDWICPTIASKLDWIHEQVMKYVQIPAPSLSLVIVGIFHAPPK